MALTKAEKEKIAERFKALSRDEQEAIIEAVGPGKGSDDLRATVEQLQKEIAALTAGKKDEKGILERLFG